jgi:hypothetical protein
VAEIVNVGGGGAAPQTSGNGGAATFSGTAFAGANPPYGGGGGTQTAGGAAGGGGSTPAPSAGSILQGGLGGGAGGGGGGGYYGGGGGGWASGVGNGGGGCGSSYTTNTLFNIQLGLNSPNSSNQAPGTSIAGYAAGVAAGGTTNTSGGAGYIIIQSVGGSITESMRIGSNGFVGIGTSNPATNLDVAGTGRFQIASTLALNVSSINGAAPGGFTTANAVSTVQGLGSAGYVSTLSLISTTNFISQSFSSFSTALGPGGGLSLVNLTSTVRGLGSAGYLSTIPSILSTSAFFTSSLVASTIIASSLQVQSFTVGSGTGWLNFGPIQTVIVSSLQETTNALYANTAFIGIQSTVNSIQYNGLFGNYNNTVLTEVSTGAGTQEFLVFKGSSTSDRIRFQTTGNFVVETGVSARLWSNTTIPTQSNATAAFFINTSSNVGIQCNAPGTALDVNGTARAILLSSQQVFTSSIFGNVGTLSILSSQQLFTSSIGFVNLAQSSSNLWVAVGLDSASNATIKHSVNGINWSNSLGGGFTSEGISVAWNGRQWVAVGDDSTSNARIKYSFDGFTWSNSASGAFFSGVGYSVAWNGRLWVAVGSDGTQNNTIKYSADGITWSNSSGTGFTSIGWDVAWNGRQWVAVGADSTANNRIKYSVDGITWSNSSGSGFTVAGYGVAWNGRLWVAVGEDATQNNTIKYSVDGITWSNSSGTGFTTAGYDVAWNGRMWVAVGLDSTANNTIKYSADGLNWSNSAGSGFTGSGEDIAWNGRLWVAVGQDSTQNNRIKYSVDGISWSNSSGTGFNTLRGRGVAFSSNVVPAYNQTNFEIEPQNIPNFLTSTNQLSFLPSTIIANNTLFVDTTNRVGINTGNPQTDLDVNGTVRSLFVSSFTATVSSFFTATRQATPMFITF